MATTSLQAAQRRENAEGEACPQWIDAVRCGRQSHEVKTTQRRTPDVHGCAVVHCSKG